MREHEKNMSVLYMEWWSVRFYRLSVTIFIMTGTSKSISKIQK